MRRLMHKLPLILGCLFLTWAMLLLVHDVTEAYGRDRYGFDNDLNWGSGNTDEFLEKGKRGIGFIADSFIYTYNDCGYYDTKLTDTGTGQVSLSELQSGFSLLYLFAACLLIFPVLAGGFTIQVYVLTGGILLILLLLGVIPRYDYLTMLVLGWIYMNLTSHWMKMKEESRMREFLREFPVILVPIYLFLILFVLVLPELMPSARLPEADKETKQMIFSRLQEIQLVSNQYEENLRLREQKNKDNHSDMNTETDAPEETDAASSETDGILQKENDNLQEMENNWLDSENGRQQETDALTGIEADQAPGNRLQELGNGQWLNQIGQIFTGENGLGFSLSSGGGVSGGRTDRTGNISFKGKVVLKAIMTSKPEENLYIRLFWAERYEENRWVQVGDMALSRLAVPVFYSLKGTGGDDGIKDEYLKLLYVEDSSENQVLSSSAGMYESEEYLNDNCLSVPEELKQLFSDQFSEIFQQEYVSDTRIVDEIRKQLDERAYYTLSSGSVPENKDFISWFLTENRKGYCMHFASAGVMMLREAGICSRYAEGYCVPASAWKVQEDGSWCADILDSNAHAWAEIYGEDENFDEGWIPVELTPAYDGELAGSFAGQQDSYVGRFVIPGGIIWAVKMVLRILCMIILAAAGFIGFVKIKRWHTYRLLHTGDSRQDIKNMMKLLLKKLEKEHNGIQKILKENNLSKKEWNEQILRMVSKLSQDAEAKELFYRFSDYVYRAAFDEEICKKDRKEAYVLYRKLKKKLNIGCAKEKTQKIIE